MFWKKNWQNISLDLTLYFYTILSFGSVGKVENALYQDFMFPFPTMFSTLTQGSISGSFKFWSMQNPLN